MREARRQEGRTPSWQFSPVSVELSTDGWAPRTRLRTRLRTAVENEKWSVIKAVTILQRFWPLVGWKMAIPTVLLSRRQTQQVQRTLRGQSALLFGDKAVLALHTLLRVPLWAVLFNLFKFSWLQSKNAWAFHFAFLLPPNPGRGSDFGRTILFETCRRKLPPVSSSGNGRGSACRGKAWNGRTEKDEGPWGGRDSHHGSVPATEFHSCAGPATLWFERSALNRTATSPLRARNQHHSSCLEPQVTAHTWTADGTRVTPTPAWSVCSTVCGGVSLCA